jgi:hypothetical protein
MTALERLYDMAFADGAEQPDAAYNEQRKWAAINTATAALAREQETPSDFATAVCSGCYSRDCNGECAGDDMMGASS